MLDIQIRLEEVKDYQEVELVARAAFYRDERIEDIGVGCTEHFMIHKLREKDGIRELNFVATLNEKIVGHVIYSNSYIMSDNGKRIETLNVGPLSVLPDFQNQGVGSKLMQFSIERATELGYGAIVFFGHPTYYPRFGFVEAKEFEITTAWGANYPAFMAMELKEGYLKNSHGKYFEAEIYDEGITKLPAKEYDKRFNI
ncbi:GNAT family N-acetyltransferase [Clostridium sp. Marseille-P299]|uniref:GNAT family N-acetyltransferase n=1 Tax=Clostridium sp. Marseille-P299 TaxID=1805477 RepID=UPI0008320626|nr:N-acetyltransferase [Clostridium sp. Marseille-P299]